MKLTNFNELWRAVNKIKIDIVAKTELGIFEKEGLDTDLSDVFQTIEGELFTILKNGDIRKTIIHICEVRQYNGTYTLPKFHIFECQTITKMRNNNRGHRYKKASGNDGEFWIIRGNDKRFSPLNICNYNCLEQYNRIYQKNKRVNDFNVEEYLNEPLKHIEPYIKVENDMTTIPTSYANNWSNISNGQKEYHKWICQKCFIDLSNKSMRKFLHTHHMDANISNNKHENLEVLCIECHSNEFQHSHIKETASYKEFIRYKERL